MEVTYFKYSFSCDKYRVKQCWRILNHHHKIFVKIVVKQETKYEIYLKTQKCSILSRDVHVLWAYIGINSAITQQQKCSESEHIPLMREKGLKLEGAGGSWGGGRECLGGRDFNRHGNLLSHTCTHHTSGVTSAFMCKFAVQVRMMLLRNRVCILLSHPKSCLTTNTPLAYIRGGRARPPSLCHWSEKNLQMLHEHWNAMYINPS